MSKKFIYLGLYLILSFSLNACLDDPEEVVQDNFWETTDAVAAGINVDSLQKAMTIAENTENFKSLLVIRGSKIVQEAYFEGTNVNTMFHLRSVTKNFTSALVGVALQKDLIDDPDQTVNELLDEPLAQNLSGVTLQHLLNMSSGLQWNEDQQVLDLINHRIEAPLEFVLEQPLVDTPGTQFNYNSLTTHLLANILAKQTQSDIETFTRQQLLEPLNITRYGWNRDPQGQAWGGFGLVLTARDLAKLGKLYLDGGVWNNQVLLPDWWVNESTVGQIEVPGSTSGYSNQWWISNTLDHPLIFGLGYGGQALMLVPELDLIVVAFQEHLVNTSRSQQQWNTFLNEIFLPIYYGTE